MAVLFNATVNLFRRNQGGQGTYPVYVDRRVQLAAHRYSEMPTPPGGVIRRYLVDVGGSDYQRGDTVQVTALDNDSALPSPARYAVGEVSRLGNRLADIYVELTGIDR